MRRHPIRQIEQDFIDITPAPPLRRIVALDDRMLRGVKMPGGVLVGRVVTAADVTAGAADPQMQPLAAASEAFLAAERARRDAADAGDMRAAFCHSVSCPFVIARSAATIAVVTLIAERPPHRTVRAAFPHTAPTLGNGGSTTRSSPAIGAPTPALCPTRV